MNSRTRYGLGPLLAAFAVGLLIGWFGIGWGLWPVQWENTDPVDLRQQAREEYLVLVATDYALTRDATTAFQRLASWPSLAALDRDVRQLADFYIAQGQAELAQRLLQLADGLPLPTGELPAQEPQGTDLARVFRGIIVAAVVIGLVAVAILLLRQRRPALATSGASIRSRVRRGFSSKGREGRVRFEEDDDSLEDAEPRQAARERPHTAASTSALEKMEAIVPRLFRRGESKPKATWELEARYTGQGMEYDQTFTLDDANGAYFGECGVGAASHHGSDPRQVNGLEVWLFDKSDIHTVAKVLVTEWAYQDEALMEELAARGEPVLAQQGATFALDGHTLHATVTVEDVQYLRGASLNSAFAQVALRVDVGKG